MAVLSWWSDLSATSVVCLASFPHPTAVGGMTATSEKTLKALKEVLRIPGNGTCADCLLPEPEWASYTLGIFICTNCSGIHRNIPDISKIKSLILDPWDDEQIQFMRQNGNEAARVKYEAHVPVYYYKPTYIDTRVQLEQWIRAKYERKDFLEAGKELPYSTGYREGFLWKRGRDNGLFLNRKFILTERDGILKYFAKNDAKEPKASIRVDNMNATFQPAKIGNPNGLQITYLKDNSTRNIFVYHEEGKEIVDWLNAFRSVQFYYLQVAFPGASDNELKLKLTRNFLKEGYMEKTGPKQTEGFKKRWFSLDHRRLMYFKDPLDAYAKGEVFIGSKDNGYSVSANVLLGPQRGGSWEFGITIVTPERNFLFICETEMGQQEWVVAFTRVMEQPMSPQEYTVAAYFKHRR
ncbi:arf-GAP with dual PH domain-containing protein 1-like precursor [Callorhinchus milii]|uniref:IP4/PIP3 binding protein-like protein n=1 Tax=Callorhinchus milii TaxID=7868 RepID=K4FTR4_CALMI|nr:arf-GAP with dual PH domain-containing protein 1-like precursor [Callorhinchus milii]AFK10759.1 IP4/PIP3 binding protein-like protein [Callorhinchus milii]